MPQATTASGYFEVQILSLTNNRGTLVDGRCCGGGGGGGKGGFPPCTTPCSTTFWLCLKEYQSNVTAIGSCSFGNVSSHALGPNTFTLTEPVTLQLHFTFRWTVSQIASESLLSAVVFHNAKNISRICFNLYKDFFLHLRRLLIYYFKRRFEMSTLSAENQLVPITFNVKYASRGGRHSERERASTSSAKTHARHHLISVRTSARKSQSVAVTRIYTRRDEA